MFPMKRLPMKRLPMKRLPRMTRNIFLPDSEESWRENAGTRRRISLRI